MKAKSCRETVDLLLDYVENRLPPAEQEALDAHFAGCPPCLEFVKSYKETPRVLRESTRAAMPDEVARRLDHFLRSRK
jgi:anti-sigma factor RsiW